MKMKGFMISETIAEIDKYLDGKYASTEPVPEKVWPNAGIIPKASRSWIDRIEYWLYRNGLGTARMFHKWFATHTNDLISSINLDTKDINFKPNDQ